MESMKEPEGIFCSTCLRYTNDTDLVYSMYERIESEYDHQDRLYHNLYHIKHMIDETIPILNQINNQEAFILATFYHDIVYTPLSPYNEDHSVLIAKEELRQTNIPENTIRKIDSLIRATIKHESKIPDEMFLIDADLSILGAPKVIYDAYAYLIREEHAFLTDDQWATGRITFLTDMLDGSKRPSIFLTEYFRDKYEETARKNMQRELGLLKKTE